VQNKRTFERVSRRRMEEDVEKLGNLGSSPERRESWLSLNLIGTVSGEMRTYLAFRVSATSGKWRAID